MITSFTNVKAINDACKRYKRESFDAFVDFDTTVVKAHREMLAVLEDTNISEHIKDLEFAKYHYFSTPHWETYHQRLRAAWLLYTNTVLAIDPEYDFTSQA